MRSDLPRSRSYGYCRNRKLGCRRGVCRKHGIAEQTFYRWKTKYGGMDVSDAKRLKALEHENNELKKIVADLTLDNRMLRDVNAKKF